MNHEGIFSVIKANMQAIIEESRGKTISETSSMRDFGADSLEMVEVISRSMKQLGIKVPRSELLTVKKVGDLVDVFERTAKRTNRMAQVYESH
jgi:acyl carrier protein